MLCSSWDSQVACCLHIVSLQVRAVDGGGLGAVAVVKVAVLDENDNPPRILLEAEGAKKRGEFLIPDSLRKGWFNFITL